MTRIALVLLASAFCLTISCSRESRIHPGPPAGEVPVAFSVSVSQEELPAGTKASGEIISTEGLRSAGFGVFACYTGIRRYSESNVSADFMHNQQVSWNYDQSVWEYAPVKYWPAGEGNERVSFFAYAPYSDGDSSAPGSNPAGYCIPSFCDPREMTDPWIIYRIHPDPQKQVDLLYALPLLDRTRPETGHRLPFQMRHALACVGDGVSVRLSDALKTEIDATIGMHFEKVQILLAGVSISYSLTPKARLVLWNQGEANWQPISSEGGLARRERVLLDVSADEAVPLYISDGASSSDTPWTGSGAGMFYIPLEQGGYAQTAAVKVRYIVRSTQAGVTADLEHTRETTLYLSEWYREGKKLDINITLNQQ